MDVYFPEPNLPPRTDGRLGGKRDPDVMRILSTPEARVELSRALDHMATSLRILDELEIPAEVGAMLDLAISRLETALNADETPTEIRSMMDRLEQEFSAAAVEPAKPSPWEIRPN